MDEDTTPTTTTTPTTPPTARSPTATPSSTARTTTTRLPTEAIDDDQDEMVCIFVDSGNLHSAGGLTGMEYYEKLRARGIITAMRPTTDNDALLRADLLPLAGWRVLGKASMVLRCWNTMDGCFIDCAAEIVVINTNGTDSLPEILMGWAWFRRWGFSVSLGSLPPPAQGRPPEPKKPLLDLFNETMGRSPLVRQEPHHIDTSTPEEVIRAQLLRPAASASVRSRVPHLIDPTVFPDDAVSPAEDEFVGPEPVPANIRDDALAAAVHFLPPSLKQRVISVIRSSPYIGNRELPLHAVGGCEIRRDFSKPLPPGPKRAHDHVPAENPELERQILADGGINWEEFIPERGSVPVVVAYPFLVHYDTAPPRLVIGSVHGNSVAESFPTAADDQPALLRWLSTTGIYLSSFDLARAFRQIRFLDPDKIYCFMWKGKYYRLLRLPMGASFSMFVLDQHMRQWFSPMLDNSIKKFVDNVFSAANSPAAAVTTFLQFFELCVLNRVVIGFKDLKIAFPLITVVGHELGIFPDGRHGYQRKPKRPLAALKSQPIIHYQDVAVFRHAAQFAGAQTPNLIQLIYPLIEMLKGLPLDHKSLSKLLVPPNLVTPEILSLRDRVVEPSTRSS
jgi:hypothetical protein